MKKTLFLMAALVSFSASAASSFKLSCDSPTDVHPALDLIVNPNTASVQILIESNSGEKVAYSAGLKAKSVSQLRSGLLSETLVLVGKSPDSFVSGNRDFFSKAMTVVLKQKTPGLSGSQTAIMTLGGVVTVHTCTGE